ncbi:integrase catalytic subunit [Burkholderia lata]|nr:integrase catalytic subunit [Burkholderia lata]
MKIPAQPSSRDAGRSRWGGGLGRVTVHFRLKTSPREIVVRTGVSRRTLRAWQGQTDRRSRTYPQRAGPRVLDAWTRKLSGRFKTESCR